VGGEVARRENATHDDYTLALMETEQEGWSSRPQISHWLCSILQIYFMAIICDLLRIMLE